VPWSNPFYQECLSVALSIYHRSFYHKPSVIYTLSFLLFPYGIYLLFYVFPLLLLLSYHSIADILHYIFCFFHIMLPHKIIEVGLYIGTYYMARGDRARGCHAWLIRGITPIPHPCYSIAE